MYIGYDLQTAVPGYLIIDDISSGFNGSATSFALLVGGVKPTPMPASPQQVLISVNGVVQEPDPTGSAGFTVTGDNIVFSSAPTNGHAFFGIVLAGADYANAGGEFPDGTIAAPSFTFANDNDTGWFREGSGSVGFSANGSQILNYDGNGLNFVDSKKLQLGSGNDLQIYHDGTDSEIKESTGNLNIICNSSQAINLKHGSENMLRAITDGAVELFHDDVKKFETQTNGITVTGLISATGNLLLNADDNQKIYLGASNDLQIYHDGTDDKIVSGSTNSLIIATKYGRIMNAAANETQAKFFENGAVELFHDNVKKFETTATGATITGALTAAGLACTGYADFTGLLSEACTVTAGKLSDNTNLNVSNGNVFLFTTQETTTCTPNLRWDGSTTLNSKVNVGDMIAITVITTAAAGGYSAQLTIDGAAVTENWVGGSAPSAGGSSGKDIYSYTIVKTADATFTVIGNLVKTSSS
jgi:hypothetical protein